MKKKLLERFREFGQKYRINRKYKDHLFRLIFQDKKDLLDLYNAINSTSYTNPDDLEITTIDDAVYIGMKNDLSFLISDVLNLYEHQSTMNPNMPFRGFLYFARLLETYVKINHLDIYGKKQIQLPLPVYIVFYNGEEKSPEETELRLSNAFKKFPNGPKPALECTARMLNINYGHNKALMEKCQRLNDYSYFIACIRYYIKQGYMFQEAIDCAVNECILKGILADILEKNRSEVVEMLLTTYDKKLHDKTLRNEGFEVGFEDGFEDGFKEGKMQLLKTQVQKKLQKGASPEQIADALEEDIEVIHTIISELESKTL